MGIVVLGAVFVDIKGYPQDVYIPGGRNAGRIEQVPGGVSRNVVEDIANVELRPTFVSLVDDTGLGEDVVRQLRNHKVNTDYMLRTPDGMGTWLAVFNNDGDVCAAISKRPDLRPLIALLDEKGDEIFRDADSIALELDMDKEIVKRVFAYAQKYHKSVYAVVSNMTIAVERRDFLQQTDCFVCNRQEAGILFVEDFEDKTVEQMQQIGVHFFHARAAPALAAEFDRGKMTQGKTSHRNLLPPPWRVRPGSHTLNSFRRSPAPRPQTYGPRQLRSPRGASGSGPREARPTPWIGKKKERGTSPRLGQQAALRHFRGCGGNLPHPAHGALRSPEPPPSQPGKPCLPEGARIEAGGGQSGAALPLLSPGGIPNPARRFRRSRSCSGLQSCAHTVP